MPDLIAKWQEGDTGAFEALVRQYEKLVLRTAYLITGDKESAADITQEVFVSVWKRRHTYNPQKGTITTWLYRITVNQCSKKHHRKQVELLSLEATAEKGLLAHADNEETAEEIMISKEEYNRLMKALSSLDVKHRSVLVLRYFNDLSYQEIAQAVNIPLGTVKSRLNQALKYLRAQLLNKANSAP